MVKLEDVDRQSFKFIYKAREYFKTLEFDHDEMSNWLRNATAE